MNDRPNTLKVSIPHPFRLLAKDGISENARGLCWDCGCTEDEHLAAEPRQQVLDDPALDAERALADRLAEVLGGLEHPVHEDDPCFSNCRPPMHKPECVAVHIALTAYKEARK